MKLAIHPSAASNFDMKAIALLDLIKETPPDTLTKTTFPSELHVAASFSDKDIIGEIEVQLTDYKGRTIARYFHFDNKRYALDSKNYLKLIEISEALQLLPAVCSKLSMSFVENSLFLWLKKKFIGENVDESFTHFLVQQAEESIKAITLWTPVANLEIEVLIPVSRSELRPLSKKVIDEWESKHTPLSNENKENVAALFDKLRKDYQGLAAVVTKVEAEPARAFQLAIEEAERITSVFGIFSGATRIPDIKCVSKIKGSENIAQATSILEYDDDRFQINHTMLDKSSVLCWKLTKIQIAEIRQILLDKISRLLGAEILYGFEKNVLNSILLYSKSAFSDDPVEKLIYILTALEGILLKNENEPIQQNLAERLAVFTFQELEGRKKIIKAVKCAYGVRSRYLHHGHTHSEIAILSEFMTYAWLFFVTLVSNIERFATKDDFINAIDDRKLRDC